MTLSNFVFYCWNLQRSLALKNRFDACRAPRFATNETVVQMLCNRCTTKNFLLGIHSTCHIIHTATGSNPARVKRPIWHAWREYVVAQWKVHVPACSTCRQLPSKNIEYHWTGPRKEQPLKILCRSITIDSRNSFPFFDLTFITADAFSEN